MKDSPQQQVYKAVPIPNINALLEKKGDELESNLLDILNSLEKDIDRRVFVLKLLQEAFEKKINIDKEVLLASSGIKKAFQHTGQELNFGAHALASIISQKEDIFESIQQLWKDINKKAEKEKNKDKKRKYISLKISLRLFFDNTTKRIDYDEQLYVLIVRYRPYIEQEMYDIFFDNIPGWSSIVQDEFFVKVYGKSIENYKLLFDEAMKSKEKNKIEDIKTYIARRIFTAFIYNLPFKYEYFNWIVDEKGIDYHKELMPSYEFSEEKLIHSAARHFDIEFFNFLLSKDHKIDLVKIGTTKLDPIHILITEAAKLDREDDALAFLESIKDKVDLTVLTKDRGYLHYSSYFFMEKLTDFFLKYEDINSEYEYKGEKYNIIEFILSQDLFADFSTKSAPYTAVSFINNLVNDRKNRVPLDFINFIDILLKKDIKININLKNSTDLSTLFNLSIPKPGHGYEIGLIHFSFAFTKDMADKLSASLDKIILNVEDLESIKNLYLSINKSKLFDDAFKLIIKGHISKQILLKKENIRDEFFYWLKSNEKYYRALPVDVLSNDIELETKFALQEYYSLLHMVARHFDSALFIKLIEEYNYELDYSLGSSKVDPIHLMMMQARISEQEDDALKFLKEIKDKINFKDLSKKRGYLHFASAIHMPKLVKFFLNYVKVNEYYDTSFSNSLVNGYDDNKVPRSIKQAIEKSFSQEDILFESTTLTPINIAFFTIEFVNLLGLPRSANKISHVIHMGSITNILFNKLQNNKMEQMRKTVRLLVSKGANINLPTGKGIYPFEGMMKSAPDNSEEALELMVEETRVSIYTPNRKGLSVKSLSNNLIFYIDEANKRHLSDEQIRESLRKRINTISNLITKFNLKTDKIITQTSKSEKSLALFCKEVFDISGIGKKDFVKLMKQFDKYPNFVKLVVKYPEEFGFEQYNENKYLDAMEKENASEELISFAKSNGYLTSSEMEEIREIALVRKIEKTSKKSKQKAKKRKEAQLEAQLTKSNSPDKEEVKEERYKFKEIISKSDEEIEEEILSLLDKKDKSTAKQLLFLLGNKKLPSLLEESLSRDELFSNILISKGYECSVKTFVKAVQLGKHRFVKKVLYEQDINLEKEEGLSNIDIDKDMESSLKNLAQYFSRNSDSYSESEEENIAKGEKEISLFEKINLHGRIKQEDRESFIEYLTKDTNKGKLLQDIEKIRANQSGYWTKYESNDFWRIRDKNVRIYYFIKDRKMTIIGFNSNKNTQLETKPYIAYMQTLTKEEGRHEDLDVLLGN